MPRKYQTSLNPDPWVQSVGQREYEQETYFNDTQLLPELVIMGWLKFHHSLAGALGPDRHPETFEIHYLAHGHLRWFVEKENYEFNTGMIFITRPNELHGDIDESLQPCELYRMQIHFPAQGNLPGLTAGATRELREAFLGITYRTFNVTNDVGGFFKRLLEEHRNRNAVHAQGLARAHLHALLFMILRDHDRHKMTKTAAPMVTWRVRRAIQWLERQIFESNVRLDKLASQIGLSASGLRARFKAETGYSMREYFINRRIDEARKLLATTDLSITGIAHNLAFSSSQHFAKLFRQQVGMSPKAYRQRHQGKPPGK